MPKHRTCVRSASWVVILAALAVSFLGGCGRSERVSRPVYPGTSICPNVNCNNGWCTQINGPRYRCPVCNGRG